MISCGTNIFSCPFALGRGWVVMLGRRWLYELYVGKSLLAMQDWIRGGKMESNRERE